jgi:hypothetical protein
VLKRLKSSPWMVGLQIVFPFVLGLALRDRDPFHFLLTKLYPPEDSVGGMGIEMNDVQGQGIAPLSLHNNLFLVQHEFDEQQTVTLMKRPHSPKGQKQYILAGVGAGNGAAALPAGSLNQASLLAVTLPPKVLVAVNVLTPPNSETSNYSIMINNFEKKIKASGDLEIETANEARNIRVLYLSSMLLLFVVGLGVAHFPKLIHLNETDLPSSSEPSSSE